MKFKISWLFPAIIVVVGVSALQSQNPIKVRAVIVEDKLVKLRWAPVDYAQMKHAQQYGYELTRYTLSDADGKPMSEVTKPMDVLPFNDSQWNQNFPSGGDIVEAARGLMSNLPVRVSDEETFIPDSLPQKKLSHAFYKYQNNANTYSFTLMLADQDFKVAQGLGLGYIDDSAQSGYTYRYRIDIINPSTGIRAEAGSYEIRVDPANGLTVPGPLTAESADKVIRISWDISGLASEYTYYNIYRSENGGAFVRINQHPFVYLDQDDKAGRATYTDSIPYNGINYTYRITGLSPFGGESGYSDPVTSAGIPDPIPLAVRLDEPVVVDGKLTLTWSYHSVLDSLPPDVSALTSIEILRSATVDGAATILESFTPPLTEFSCDPSNGYYSIAAIDQNNYRYTSVPRFYQAIDSVPPAPPQGVSAILRKDNKALLTWAANAEPDLSGYRVFYTYLPGTEPLQVTSDDITGTEYITGSLDKLAHGRVYYAIAATDHRHNMSALSSWVELVLPDRLPPSRPVLHHAVPRPEGIRLGWDLATDADLARHTLQRKVREATTWNSILTILPGQSYPLLPLEPLVEASPSRYIDTDSLDFRVYDYRIMAADSSGNVSYSDVLHVRPYDDGFRGEIRDLTASLVPRNQTYTPNSTLSLTGDLTQSNLVGTNITSGDMGTIQGNVTSDGLVVRIKWEYSTKFPSSLRTFSIYQKVAPPGTVNNAHPGHEPPFVLIHTIDARKAAEIASLNSMSGYMYYVEGLNIKNLYDPSQVGVVQTSGHGSGIDTTDPTAVVVFDNVSYMVVANHAGGGKSGEKTTFLTQ